MAAGEHEPQPVVRLLDDWVLKLGQLVVVECIAPELVDGPAACHGHQPRARTLWNPLDWPALKRDEEGILDDLLCDLKVAQDADKRSHQPARFFAENGIERRMRLAVRCAQRSV